MSIKRARRFRDMVLKELPKELQDHINEMWDETKPPNELSAHADEVLTSYETQQTMERHMSRPTLLEQIIKYAP